MDYNLVLSPFGWVSQLIVSTSERPMMTAAPTAVSLACYVPQEAPPLCNLTEGCSPVRQSQFLLRELQIGSENSIRLFNPTGLTGDREWDLRICLILKLLSSTGSPEQPPILASPPQTKIYLEYNNFLKPHSLAGFPPFLFFLSSPFSPPFFLFPHLHLHSPPFFGFYSAFIWISNHCDHYLDPFSSPIYGWEEFYL